MKRNHPGSNPNAEPFFAIIMDGLKGEVDGPHFWYAVAENAVFEFLYTFPGAPTRIEGRAAYMDWFSNYRTVLHSADNLKVYHCTEPAGVIVLEYEVHGTMARTGKPYDNRFCSIVSLCDRRIVAWRGYMDGVATLNAIMSDPAEANG